jgi:alkanesulfonate monooxygenase SsuD/methylene tetrahydromethanopterin reductase-like flavin-dependent oxidoreductase (luciferase family)
MPAAPGHAASSAACAVRAGALFVAMRNPTALGCLLYEARAQQRNRGTVKLGYKLMAEEHGPTALVRNTLRAEQAGFAVAAISDHFFTWLDEQGHAPFAWSVLGAAAQATRQIELMTAVTCPIMRYHPAIVAQGAATLAVLGENRFILGLGAGERLNEHIVGEGWPGFGERHERLSEAYDIIRGLLDGSMKNQSWQILQPRRRQAVRPPRARARDYRRSRWTGGRPPRRAQDRWNDHDRTAGRSD